MHDTPKDLWNPIEEALGINPEHLARAELIVLGNEYAAIRADWPLDFRAVPKPSGDVIHLTPTPPTKEDLKTLISHIAESELETPRHSTHVGIEERPDDGNRVAIPGQ